MGPTEVMTLGAVVAGLAGLVVLALLTRLARRRGRRLGLADLVPSLWTMTVVLGVSVVLVVMRGVTSSTYTVAHVVYLGLVVSGPIVGAGVAVAALVRWSRPAAGIVAVLLLAPVPVGWHATHRAPFALRVDRVDLAVPAARSGREPLRVGVLADLQTNQVEGYEQGAVTTLLGLAPDLILVAGDLFQGNEEQFERELPALRELVARLRAPGGVYAVRGDVDIGDRLDRIVRGSGITILDYDVVHRVVGDRRVAIGGNALLWAPPPAEAMRKELIASDPAEIRILLSHRPDVVLLVPPAGVDLVVSGHTHGGQVALPWWGPLEYASRVPRPVAAGGLHRLAGNSIYVSSGVGIAREQAPQIRFFTRPSVGLVTLR